MDYVKGHCILPSQQTLPLPSGPQALGREQCAGTADLELVGTPSVPALGLEHLPGTAPAQPLAPLRSLNLAHTCVGHTCLARCLPFASRALRSLGRRLPGSPGELPPAARRAGSSAWKMRPGAACECDPHCGRGRGYLGRGESPPCPSGERPAEPDGGAGAGAGIRNAGKLGQQRPPGWGFGAGIPCSVSA